MKNKLKAWLPKPETVQRNRWLRWMGRKMRWFSTTGLQPVLLRFLPR